MKITIPDDLFELISERSKEKGFKTPEAYIAFALKKIVGNTNKTTDSSKAYSNEEEEIIKKRLRDLGYIE